MKQKRGCKMIYDILNTFLAILSIPTGIYLYLTYKSVAEMFIRFFLFFCIIFLISEVFKGWVFDLTNKLTFFIFVIVMFGWFFSPLIEEFKIFKDYQKKKVGK